MRSHCHSVILSAVSVTHMPAIPTSISIAIATIKGQLQQLLLLLSKEDVTQPADVLTHMSLQISAYTYHMPRTHLSEGDGGNICVRHKYATQRSFSSS